jgi:hypothetical protein
MRIHNTAFSYTIKEIALSFPYKYSINF